MAVQSSSERDDELFPMNQAVPHNRPAPVLASPKSLAPEGFRAVHRAIGEARRGVPVRIAGLEEAGAPAVVAVPAETLGEEAVAVFVAATEGDAYMLLSTSCAAPVVLPVTHLTVAALQSLADPMRSQAQRHTPAPAGALPAGVEPAAALALAKLARLLPATLVARCRPGAGLDLLAVNAHDILIYPTDAAAALTRVAEAAVPMAEASDARVVAFRPPDGGIEHLAILIGNPEAAYAPLARIHSECFTGDLLGSLRCDCGPQLHQAIGRMAAEGAGVVLYMAQEGRGIGLVNKLRAYTLQDSGLDTLDANRALGFEADERSFAPAATMLFSLGITRIRLLTNNPDKVAGLARCGIDVAGRVSNVIAANGVNDFYLETKARRFGHLLG